MVLVGQGDRRAYGELFARWQGPVWAYLVRKTRDRQSASELFQEVFLRVWRSADTFREGQPFKPWLYRVSSNVARDRFRYDRREVQVVDVEVERTGRLLADPISGVDLERAIDRLPDILRDAFLLGGVHGLDHNEMAEALDITPANARARLSRARARLRAELAAMREGTP